LIRRLSRQKNDAQSMERTDRPFGRDEEETLVCFIPAPWSRRSTSGRIE